MNPTASVFCVCTRCALGSRPTEFFSFLVPRNDEALHYLNHVSQDPLRSSFFTSPVASTRRDLLEYLTIQQDACAHDATIRTDIFVFSHFPLVRSRRNTWAVKRLQLALQSLMSAPFTKGLRDYLQILADELDEQRKEEWREGGVEVFTNLRVNIHLSKDLMAALHTLFPTPEELEDHGRPARSMVAGLPDRLEVSQINRSDDNRSIKEVVRILQDEIIDVQPLHAERPVDVGAMNEA